MASIGTPSSLARLEQSMRLSKPLGPNAHCCSQGETLCILWVSKLCCKPFCCMYMVQLCFNALLLESRLPPGVIFIFSDEVKDELLLIVYCPEEHLWGSKHSDVRAFFGAHKARW